MGLFDAIRGKTTPQFSTQQAIMTIVLAAIKADGHVSDEEIRRLQSMCALSPIFADNSRDEDLAIMRFADNVTTQLGDKAIQNASATLSSALKETAFAFACDMVLSDGLLADSEEQLITLLASEMGVSESTAKSVILATIIRNRGAYE